MIAKLKVIAALHKRSANKEFEFILEEYIKEYESKNGEISVEL